MGGSAVRAAIVALALIVGVPGGPAWVAESHARPGALRPVHTYSIVARDPDTGEMGVAVQSHWFSVGSLIPWAEAGVGAVATQSFVDVRYGASGLDLMRAGWSAEQTLRALTEADPHAEIRQVAMIDAKGTVAVHTGGRCIQYAGHELAEDFAVQANLMLNDGVWPAMAAAFRTATGTLAQRMLQALEAAQGAGGDLRGRQSAAILVVRARATGRAWEDRVVDLHVEDHPQPLGELRRLLTLHEAYQHMNRGDLAMEANDVEAALREYAAAQILVPENLEMRFWHGVSLVNAHRVEDALPIFAAIFEADENWRSLVPRLAAAGLLPGDPAVIDRIVSVGRR